MVENWDEQVRRERIEGRLRAGWVVEIDGREYRVDYVNDSRAYCLPVGRDADDEKKSERGINIAPTSMVKILRKEEPMAKRLCVVCGKGLHSDNKGDTHRACRKQHDHAAGTIGEAGAVTTNTETAAAEPAPATEESEVAKKTTTKKAAAPKAAKTEGAARGNSYQIAAKQPKEGFLEKKANGFLSQAAATYKAVEAIGTATTDEIVAYIQKKDLVESKGNLKANVAFHVSKLKGAGYIKIAR